MLKLPKLSDIKSLSALLALTLVGGYAGKLYQLVDQSFTAQISAEALRAHVLVSYIPFVLNYLAIGFGFTLIVLVNKGETEKEKAQYFSGSIMAMALIGLVTALVVCCFSRQLASLASISQIPGAQTYLVIMSIAGALLMISTMGKYLCVALRKPLKMVIADGIGCTVNILGDMASIRFFSTDRERLIGIGTTTLIVQVVILTFYLVSQRHFLHLGFEAVTKYWARASKLIGGNLLWILLSVAVPITYTAYLNSGADTSLASAYNIGFSLVSFFAIPIFALGAVGTGWLSASWNEKDPVRLSSQVSAILAVALLFVVVPAALVYGFLPMIMKNVYNLASPSDLYFTQAFILSLIPSALSVAFLCIVNSGEKPKLLALSDTFSHFVIGLPIFIFYSLNGNFLMAALGGVFIPSTLNAICTAWFGVRMFQSTFFPGVNHDQDQPEASY